MPNKRYISGRAHEYAIKKKWEKDGWTVLRTAGSHGEFDLIAIRQAKDESGTYLQDGIPERWHSHINPQIVLIQAKSGKSAGRERKKLSNLKDKWSGIYSVRVELL